MINLYTEISFQYVHLYEENERKLQIIPKLDFFINPRGITLVKNWLIKPKI
jgi:hypothetical protein